MTKLIHYNVKNLPEVVAHRIRVLAATYRVSQATIIGRAIAKLEGKASCPGCGILKGEGHTGGCKAKK